MPKKTGAQNQEVRFSILLAEEQEIFLTGFIRTLRRMPFIGKICTAVNAAETLSILEYMHCDIVILGTTLPGLRYQNTVKKIHESYPDTKIIGYGNLADVHAILSFFHDGGNGYFLKNCSRTEIRKALKTVLEGKNYLSPALQDALNEYSTGEGFLSLNNLPFLKSRQLHDLLVLICKEFSTKEIASELHIAEKTVEKYKSQLMKATGTKTTVGLALYAVKNNLVDLN